MLMGDGTVMKHITKILFGFVCGVFLCVAPVVANDQDDCQNCKDLFNDIGTDPNLCDLGSTPKDKCATITDNKPLATICSDSVEDWCAAYRKEEGAITADDFCQDTTYCTGGGGGTGGGGTGGGGTGGQCIDSCNIGQKIVDYGYQIRVDTTSCDASTNWRCETKIEYCEVVTGNPENLCTTGGSCEKNDCKYSDDLNGVVCDGQGGMDNPYCSCPDINESKKMLCFRLACGTDSNNENITCGSNLFCDLTHSSSGICRYKKQCSDCPKISDWDNSETPGYQVKITNTCNFTTGECNIETKEYRCAKGYYGRPLGLTGCEKCPDNATCITGATTFECKPGYYRETLQATSCTKCPDNATCDATTFKCNPGYYRATGEAKKCEICPVPSTFSENNYTYYADKKPDTDIGVTSCALAVGSTVEDDIGFYEIVNTQCQYQQGK